MWSKLVFAAATTIGLLHNVRAATVDFNHEIAVSYAGDGVRFLADANDVVSKLMSMEDYYPAEDLIECNVASATKENSGTVTVLLAISKCLSEEDLHCVEDWVRTIKSQELTYFKDGQYVHIEFGTTVVPGECQELSEKNAHGRDDEHPEQWHDSLLSTDVQPSDLERISHFSEFGRVLDGMPERDDIPIAVISVVNNDKSFDEVEQYERMFKIDKTFNFRVCHGGESCDGHFENCIMLQDGIDLFMYNPFTVTRSFQCDNLADGLPISYINSHGERKCYCGCPVGTQRMLGELGPYCQQIDSEPCQCVWEQDPLGYKYLVTEPIDVCHFDHITDWGVHVPFPADNYVADERVNQGDDGYGTLAHNPHVRLTSEEYRNMKLRYLDLMEDIRQHLEIPFVGPYRASQFPMSWADLIQEYPWVEDVLSNHALISWGEDRVPMSHDLFTWRDYQEHRQSKIDALEFTKFGKFYLELYAEDYSHDATCSGCVAIVDENRPRATTQCPASFCDNTTSMCAGYDAATSEMTMGNLERANDLVGNFYRYQDNAQNDACSVDNRCDRESYALKNFYEDDYCQTHEYQTGRQCFRSDIARSDWFNDDRSRENPLVTVRTVGYPARRVVTVNQDDEPVRPGQCTRCCSYSVKLQELWTDFSCEKDYDLEFCSGDDDQECDFKQCLTLNGDTLAIASARIQEDVVEESERVLSEIVNEGFQTYTQVHRALECTSFRGTDGKCDFQSTIANLIETKAEANLDVPAGEDINDYVFWRYRVQGDTGRWRLFSDNFEHTFVDAQTKITIEAWTTCGRVRRFFFYVHLHPNTRYDVCSHFEHMWYQTSVSRLPIAADLCAYPQSDFAELTFDFRPQLGMIYDRNKVQMNVTSVVCSLHYIKGQPATTTSEVEILRVEGEAPDIVERFAIELNNKDKTRAITRFHISCDFTYTAHDGTPIVNPCCKDFSVIDCDGPEIDISHGECKFDTCAGNELPGPFEVCGGNVVSSDEHDTFFTPPTEEKECCQSCLSETACVPILGLPDSSKDIKRCVPQIEENGEYGEYGEYGGNGGEGYYSSEVLMARAQTFGSEHASVLAGVGLTAMVALVALVVVRRRRTTAEKQMAEDAYYPLLH